MRWMTLALLIAAGCGTPGKAPGEPIDDVGFEALLAQRIAFDATTLKLGDFAFYAVKVQGEQPQYVKWAVVARQGANLWIENKLPPNPRSWIIKSKFSPKGKLLEQWRGEAGTMGPVRVYPPKDASPAPPVRRDSSRARATSRTSMEQLTVGGKTYACTKITTTLRYSGGRTSTMVNWCSKDVPFSLVVDGKSYGGLVRRSFGRLTMDLVNAGNTPPRPELTIPSR